MNTVLQDDQERTNSIENKFKWRKIGGKTQQEIRWNKIRWNKRSKVGQRKQESRQGGPTHICYTYLGKKETNALEKINVLIPNKPIQKENLNQYI